MKIKVFSVMIIIIAAFALFQGETAMAEQDQSIAVSLPDPVFDSKVSVEQALKQRRSVRNFSGKPLTLQDVSQLLWAAQGVTSSRGFRTAPSAGALYPLEVYLAAGNIEDLPEGLYHYRPDAHDMTRKQTGDPRQAVWQAAMKQSVVRDAPAVFIITGVFSRTMEKYGKRGLQYVLIEAGHAAQNVCLQAVAMDLGSVSIGAFSDETLRKVLNAGDDIYPIYVLPVGYPAK